MSSLTQPTGTRTVSTIPAAATTTARLGSSNVAGWSVDGVSLTRLPRSSTVPYSTPAPSSGGVNTVAVGAGAGVGGAIVLAAAAVLAVLYQRRKTRRNFVKKTRALSEMRSANFAPDIPNHDRV